MQLEAKNIGFRYTKHSPYILNSVSLTVDEGERLGLVAPSGYGKTTLAKILSGYEYPTMGQVLLNQQALAGKGTSPIQLISQHPENVVNPRWKMRMVLEEAGQLKESVMEALGIEPQWLSRYPGELSGGELQRFCIARALGRSTRFLIADEITTMLDVITQAQIWNHLLREATSRNLGMVVITHNIALAHRICTRTVDLEEVNQE